METNYGSILGCFVCSVVWSIRVSRNLSIHWFTLLFSHKMLLARVVYKQICQPKIDKKRWSFVVNTLSSSLYFRSWHRIAVSIKGDSVTLLVDCEVRGTLKLNRQPGSTFNLAGALVVGVQITPDQYYEVSFNIINDTTRTKQILRQMFGIAFK